MTLIYSDKYRGWGKRKPRQWGPLSAVRSSVLDYYENKLGIEPPQLYIPFLKGSGPSVANVGSNMAWIAFSGNPEWTVDGARTDNNEYIDTGIKLNSLSNQYTLLTRLSPAYLSSTVRKFFLGQYNYNSSAYNFGFYVQQYAVSFYAASGVSTTSSTQVSVGVESEIAVTHDGNTVSLFFDGKPEGTPATTTTGLGSTYNFKFGHTWDVTLAYANIIHKKFSAFNYPLEQDQIALEADAPYAAIMPRVPTDYFFPSAGGGTTETLYPDSAGITLAGQAMGINARTVIPLASASIALTGNALLLGEPETLYPGSATVALTGSNLSLNEVLYLDSGAVALAGQTMGINAQDKITMDGAGVQYTGRPLKINEILKLDAATIRYVGRNLVWPTTGKTAPGKLRMGHSLRLR